jgi:hypothetical protein
MIRSRAIASPSEASQTVSNSDRIDAQAVHQDDQGPLDGELLDLYVAILIVVPFACLLRALWF